MHSCIDLGEDCMGRVESFIELFMFREWFALTVYNLVFGNIGNV